MPLTPFVKQWACQVFRHYLFLFKFMLAVILATPFVVSFILGFYVMIDIAFVVRNPSMLGNNKARAE